MIVNTDQMNANGRGCPKSSRLLSAVISCSLAASLCPISPAFADQDASTSETQQEAAEQNAKGAAVGDASAELPEESNADVEALFPVEAEPASQAVAPVSEEESEPATAEDTPNDSAVSAGDQAANQASRLTEDGAADEALSAAMPAAEAVSAPSSATGGSTAPASARATDLASMSAEILRDCAVELVQDGAFGPASSGTHVKVRLSEKVERCNLTIFAYASNTAFDPDSSQNVRLWSGMVTDGYDADVNFNAAQLPLKAGYSVIACLNVPITEDYYRACNSQPVRVLDENGEGFVDYSYPDAFIVEDELEAGATSLHVGLTGDERLFQAAREGKISLTLSIAQYPADEDFDFEGENQRPLCSPIDVTASIDNLEVQLTEPLRAGWRVRAVVYWSQNTDLFLTKGNDYESVFNRPDDSVLVNEDKTPAASIEGQLTSSSREVPLVLSGDIPSGSMVIVKKFAAGDSIASDKGTPVGMAFNVVAGSLTVALNDGATLAEGDVVAAFVLSGGQPIAQTAPVSVDAYVPVELEVLSPLTTASKELRLSVRLTEPSLADKVINAVQLRKMNADGTPTTDFVGVVAAKYLVDQGEVVLDLSDATLTAGEQLCVNVKYYNADIDYCSAPITVADMSRDEVVLQGETASESATELTVDISGCAAFEGGRLILTTGPASETDADSRTQVAQTLFTGAGRYTLSIPAGRLKAGQSVMAHLYKYDADTDVTAYKYGTLLPIVSDATQAIEPQVEIVTQNLTADRSDFWALVNFDPEKTARLNVYSYDGDTWSADDRIYSEFITPSANSQRITFGEDKLVAGGKVVAELLVFGGGTTVTCVSQPCSVAAAPQKQQPVAVITSPKITAGMTTVKASLTFDSADEGAYTLYRLGPDEADLSQATALSSGTLYRSDAAKSIYLGPGKLAAGDRLQVVLTAGGKESRSSVVTVEASPDWGTPTVTFGNAAVTTDAKTVDLTVRYADEYREMDDFYCDVSVYQVPARYSDEEIEEGELWENYGIAQRVGQLNSNFGEETRGEVTVNLYDWVELKPGYRLFAKLRLPHTEWEGEEVDYVASSIPVLEAGEELPPCKVLLYNLGADTARGAHIRAILGELGVDAETVTSADLGQEIGYLAGLSGFEASAEDYDGGIPATEFMVMCGFSESLLDKFLDVMQAQSIRIDHKAIVTDYNRYYTLGELIGDIEGEHEVFQALLALDKVIKAAEEVSANQYGESELWAPFQEALAQANAVLSSVEPTVSQLNTAKEELIAAGNALTGGSFWEEELPGPMDPIDPVDPVDPVKPVSPVDPVRPIQPSDPAKPSVPASPSRPSGASKPSGSVQGNGTPEAAGAGQSGGPGAIRPSAQGENAGNRESGRVRGGRPARADRAGRGADGAVDRHGRSAAVDATEDESAVSPFEERPVTGKASSSSGAASAANGSSSVAAQQAISDDETPLAQTALEESTPWGWALGAAAVVVAAVGGWFALVTRRRKQENEA